VSGQERSGGLALEAEARELPRPERGARVVMDVRALQDPERAPVTAGYLHGLLLGEYVRDTA